MKQRVTVFKTRIDSIKKHAIGFELFAGEKVKDTYVNVVAKGGYGVKSRLLLTPKQFADFAQRLIAYVYIDMSEKCSDEQLKILWDLRLNIFDSEVQQTSNSFFQQERSRLTRLGLVKREKNARKKISKT